jgi:peptidoglycan/xylan/chitin deacetylase (PgdA/CDA1 family)
MTIVLLRTSKQTAQVPRRRSRWSHVCARSINLTFHGIGEPDRRLDPGEDDVWLSRTQFLAALDALGQRSDVRITFDDGNVSDVELALPALRSRGLSATFFVVAGRIGTPGFLDERGIQLLQRAGMTIGSHGMSHRPWRQLAPAALHEELIEARRRLEEVTGNPVTDAACPFGSYDRRALRMLRRSEYRHVYTSDRGTARASNWIQPRNTLRPGDEAGVLERILSSERPPYTALRAMKRVAKRWR